MENSGSRHWTSLTIGPTAIAFVLVLLFAANRSAGQDVPLLSGGIGFFTSTNGGDTNYQPHIEPLIAAPLGKSLLFESRGIIFEEFSPNSNGQSGYSHSHFADLIYMQGDYLATRHLTVVGGSYLIPFNTYNDRLSPIWIGNFQDAPLDVGIGTLNSGTGLGGMLSGSAASNSKYSISYNAWFSARSGNFYFNSERSSGGRVFLYLPERRLEIGTSYDRSLQGTQENFSGVHLWWEPKDTGFQLRSEFSHGAHAYGYWIEGALRLNRGADNWIGRFEPVFRMQQTFRINNLGSDNVPPVNTQRADFGFNYNLPHNTRIITSYSRQFSANGDVNIWETGIVYRYLFPTWKGREQ